jgi:protein-S-isoprenylcysteine O-methyltransferase Ste14
MGFKDFYMRDPTGMPGRWRRLRRWLKSTSNRTFCVYPLAVCALEFALRGGVPDVRPWALPLLAWGYLQYRLVGSYRLRLGRGGPGVEVPPEAIVERGPYAVVRNPMYLGHLIFMVGLALALRSWIAAVLFIFHAAWFNRRVAADEARLEALFGAPYLDYKARVKRWIPGVY